MIKRLSDRFLQWYCHTDYYPDISGDLEEMYLRTLSSQATWKSQFNHLLRVLALFRPSLLKPISQLSLIKDTGMFRNYFKISIRSLSKHKVYTSINVLGLAIGLAGFLLINEYIRFEKSYDRFFTKSDQLHRLSTDLVVDGVRGVRDAMSFNPSGKVLTEELPEILNYTTTYKFSDIAFKLGEEVINEKMVIAVDSNFLKLFDYTILEQDGSELLSEPNTLVLTKSKAEKYFGNKNPIGQHIFLYSRFSKPFKVVAVIEDIPQNTHYRFDIIMSISTIKDILESEKWNGFNYYTFLKLQEGADLQQLNEKLIPLSRKYIGEESILDFTVLPVADIHLHSDFTFEPEQHGNAKSVGFLTIISIFVLVIAWVNYINLSTARAVDRAKEVGLRKVIGARRKQLLMQFLFEAVMINLMGAILAFGLAEVSLPFFNELVGKEIIGNIWNEPNFLRNLFAFSLIGALLSGFYPALVLSGFKPIDVLKGKFNNSKRGVLLRKGLVVVQFSASLILLASTFIVYQQVQHMSSIDLGMNIEQVIGFPNPRVANADREQQRTKLQGFHQKLKQENSILDVAQISNLPGGGNSDINSNTGIISIPGFTEKLQSTTYIQGMDEKAMDLLDFDMLYGRTFDKNIKSDSNAVIVNEAFIRRFNIPVEENLINQKVKAGNDENGNSYLIVGIVKDVTRSTAKNKIEPTAYYVWQDPSNTLVKLSAQNMKSSLSFIEKTWSEYFPTAPLNYTFLDDRFAKLYEEDKKFGNVFASFSLFAIIVASLGLFGLASFLAIQRTKEVGVRKVLGASIIEIVLLFFKDFLVLICISALIGGPIIYFGMNIWLDNYAFRIDFPWLVLFASVFILLIFAFTTIGYQTYRVAILNPAKTLKYE